MTRPILPDRTAPTVTPAGRKRVSPTAVGPEFEAITTRQGFDVLEPEWNALFERAGLAHQMFQSFNWNRHWCDVYLGAAGDGAPTPCVVTARQAGKLVLVWPLIRDGSLGLDRLTWMGAPVSQYGDVLVDDAPQRRDWLRAAWDFIVRELRPDVVWLEKVRGDAVLADIAAETGAQRIARTSAPYLPLDRHASYDAYIARFSKRKRKTWSRLARRMAEHGPVNTEVLREGEQAAAATADAIAFKRDWLKAHNLISRSFADARFERFFLAAARSRAYPAGLHVTRISCGGVPAAIEVALRCKGRHAAHIGALNPRFAAFRPGAMQLRETIAACIEAGLTTYDFLPPGDAYKSEWTDETAAVHDYAAALTAAGQAYVGLYCRGVRPLAKKAFTAMPERLRGAIAARIHADP